jgi:hypothetical protein
MCCVPNRDGNLPPESRDVEVTLPSFTQDSGPIGWAAPQSLWGSENQGQAARLEVGSSQLVKALGGQLAQGLESMSAQLGIQPYHCVATENAGRSIDRARCTHLCGEHCVLGAS